jgi:hypothetical protein
MASNTEPNLIKIRDDNEMFCLESQVSNGALTFSVPDGSVSPSWLPMGEQNESIKLSVLRKGIEPWLTSLFQSEHLSLLVGTGLSYSVKGIAIPRKSEPTEAIDATKPNTGTEEPASKEDAMASPELGQLKYSAKILAEVKRIAKINHRGEDNIEDQIRVINELLRGLQILGKKDEFEELGCYLKKTLDDFIGTITGNENAIATAENSTREDAFACLVNFLMSFASRTGTRERLNIFTTNYDRIIEAGAELAGLHFIDRFVGILAPIFRSSRLDIDMHYNPPGIRGEPRYLEGVARFTKLHGSIDWVDIGSDIRRIGLPFGSKDISSFLNAPGLSDVDSRKVMIYPNSSKDRETAEYPYVELFRDFAAALCRPNSTLVTYGYGFGDDHINRVIRDMLTIPSTHLVIISYDDTGGRITQKFKDFGRKNQISLIIGRDLADLKTLVDYFLPMPAIDRATMRMNELIRQRYSEPKESERPKPSEKVSFAELEEGKTE